ncbi:small multi-drug export protein [Shouchella lonarensis]|uniref:Small multi-drug export protein n=1 Tax=Shouchella lonarensis TaxID=1464122 RepID=A0A1G6GV48_9BACI|nr:small multi-drug export protein [Shouchella lonarensis]SDB85920.1 Putative small multi-drug export protein [Shouchella lonarensis]
MQDFINQLSEMNEIAQHLGIFLIGMIPLLEVFFAATVGAFVGAPFVTVLLVAMIGNWVSVMIIILPFDALFTRLRKRKQEKKGFIHGRAEKARRMYEKYGVPGLAILTPIIAPGHIAAFTSLAAGASKNKVIFWHTISIFIWGVLGIIMGYMLGFTFVR